MPQTPKTPNESGPANTTAAEQTPAAARNLNDMLSGDPEAAVRRLRKLSEEAIRKLPSHSLNMISIYLVSALHDAYGSDGYGDDRYSIKDVVAELKAEQAVISRRHSFKVVPRP